MKKKEIVKIQHIRTRKSNNIGRAKVRPNTWLFPQSIERKYLKQLKSLAKEISEQIQDNLIFRLELFHIEVNSKNPKKRTDDFLSSLQSWIKFVKDRLQPEVDKNKIQAIQIGVDINNFNYNQFQKINENVFGVDIFRNEPWLQDQLKLFSSQNSNLIQSMPDQELERVSGIIERSLQQGVPIKEIQKEIKKSFGITERRAKLIARDQTTKLNASLTKLRQTEIGIQEYQWQTSGDERVRDSHKANDGKIFRWDKPPSITGHPGNDVNCRCVALPILDHLLD